MREDELRALVRNDPAGFRQYVGFLKTECGRKWRIADMAHRANTVILAFLWSMIGIMFVYLVIGALVDVGARTDEVYVAGIATLAVGCMSGVAIGVLIVVGERILRIDREIDLAESIASADLVAGRHHHVIA